MKKFIITLFVFCMPLFVLAQEKEDEEEEEDEITTEPVAADPCLTYNIIKDIAKPECLVLFENDQLTFKHHQLWREGIIIGLDIPSFITDDGSFNEAFPLSGKYKYNRFEFSVNRLEDMQLQPWVTNIKNSAPNAKQSDFIHSSGKTGTIVIQNYLHDGTLLNRYDAYAFIPTNVKGSYLFARMRIYCYLKTDTNKGIQLVDEAAFKKFATAYFNQLKAK